MMGSRLLILRLTDRCNNRCWHCFSSSGVSETGEITLEQSVSLLEKLIPEGFGRVILTGGEPLLRWQFCQDLMDWAGEHGVAVSFSTNATLLDKDKAMVMREHQVWSVQVSLMGSCAKSHDRMSMVAGSFARAVDGIRNTVAVGVPARIRFTITQQNWQEVRDVVDLCIAEGVSQFRVKPLIATGRAQNMQELIPTSKQQLEVNRYLLEVRESGAIDVYFHPPSMEFLSGDMPVERATPCPCGDKRVCVTSIGDIKICGQSELRLGNVFCDDVVDVLRHHPFIVAKRNRTRPEACSDCPDWDWCLGGCISATMAVGGDFSSPPAGCPRLRERGVSV